MGVRTTLATSALGAARSFGRSLGCEIDVTLDNQRIQTRMVVPGEQPGKVWDPDMYYRGNVYRRGYCNPIKPRVEVDKDPSELDRGMVEVSSKDAHAGESGGAVADGGESQPVLNQGHARLMSSLLYKKHMDNHMISELVTPDEKWNKVFMGLLMVAGIVIAFGVLAVMLATGAI